MKAPGVGRARVEPDGSILVTLSTRKRTIAPSNVVARARAAEAAGCAFSQLDRGTVVAQEGGRWMTWKFIREH